MLHILGAPSTVDLLPELRLPRESIRKIHDLAATLDLPEEPDHSMSGRILRSCDRFIDAADEKLGTQITELLKSLERDIPSAHEARAATEWVDTISRLLRNPPDDAFLSEVVASTRPILNGLVTEDQRLVQNINSRERSVRAADWGAYMTSRDFSVAAKILAIAETRLVRAMWRDLNGILGPEQRSSLLGFAQSLRTDMANDLALLATSS
jgi:hypothetical protein